MALFGSLLGAGVSLLGSKIAGGQERRAADRATQAGRTIIPDELRDSFARSGEIGDQQLGLFSQLANDQQNFTIPTGNRAALEAEETNRLQELRRPSIDRARAQLQSRLLNRGRGGVGVGGGRTGGLFNPQSAALEEAILQAQLGDITQAQDRAFMLDRTAIQDARFERAFNVGEQQRALGNARGLFQTASGAIERPNAGLAAMQAQPGFNQARTTRGFFSGLGTQLGNADIGGFFSGGGGAPQRRPLTGAGLM